MIDSQDQDGSPPQWSRLALAVLVLLLTLTVLAVLWQVPRLLPDLAERTSPPVSSPPPAATPVPSVQEPTITRLYAEADDTAHTISFYLGAEVPPDRQVSEVRLWYDTELGRRVHHITAPISHTIGIGYVLDAQLEGFTRTLTTTRELDYWWSVGDTAGDTVRSGGTVAFGPQLASLVTAPLPEPPPLDFTWTMSQTAHFRFYYVPGTAAERDRFALGPVAEESLALIQPVLETDFEGQMDVYLVPRVFWQGGAAYGDKVQLISYLDRNYTSAEVWSYFTHEGTHALAQDILQPKEDGGGPDGVLVEGLAVWASGGHYGHEPIDEWAAVVAASEEYLPLTELHEGQFYEFQHETSYLESGSFVQYLVDRYGLDTFKALYGQVTSDAEHDDVLVRELYGKGYADLEAEWLDHLAGLQPSAEQAELWRLQVRTFDLMRRYETELDPDARLLPPAPSEWMSDTLKVFLSRANSPANLVLETALIAAHERTEAGDLDGAHALLDDIAAALDADGALVRPLLAARRQILEALAEQDRVILRADAEAYRNGLVPGSPLSEEKAIAARLALPFRAYRQEPVRLDISKDGLRAQGVVLLHADVADGDLDAGDGRLFAVEFVRDGGRWLMSAREPAEPDLSPPPPRAD